MNSELDREAGQNEGDISPEAIKMQKFYDAYKYLEFHRIFNTTPGEIIDLTQNELGLSIADGFGLTEEESKGIPYDNHRFDLALDIQVVKVNPDTDMIDNDPTKNTKVQFWFETGPWEKDLYKDTVPEEEYSEIPEDRLGGFTHDPNLDCGGDTFEDAIIALASLVKQNYDNPQTETTIV